MQMVHTSPITSANIGSTAPHKERNDKRKTQKQSAAAIGERTSMSRNMLAMPRTSTMGTPDRNTSSPLASDLAMSSSCSAIARVSDSPNGLRNTSTEAVLPSLE